MEIHTDQPGRFRRWIAREGGGPRVLLTAGCAWAVGFLLSQVVEGRPLRPGLAIQMMTLIAIFVYVYFTIRMAHPPAWTVLRINPRLNEPALHPEVENRTSRRLHVRIIVRLWVDKRPILLGPFYRGDHYFPVDGRLSPTGIVPLGDYLEWSGVEIGSQELLVQFYAEWIDNLWEMGTSTKYWRVDLRRGETAAVIDPMQQQRLFGSLTDPYDEDPET